MLHVVWEFRVRREDAPAFEERYAPTGEWARLFARAAGFERTLLLRDETEPGRYLTVDVWRDAAALEAFRGAFAGEYEALDRASEALTAEERCLGRFEEPPRGPGG